LGSVAGSCEHEPSASIKGRVFLDLLSDSQLQVTLLYVDGQRIKASGMKKT
jgi:hypothetical protein